MNKAIQKVLGFLADDGGSVPIEYVLFLAPSAGLILLGWLRTVAGMANVVAAEPS